jgi:hypothetical protein
MPLHNKQECLVRVGMIPLSSFGPALWANQDPNFKDNFPIEIRDISNPCVRLEATHPINRCSGQAVHTTSFE